MIENSRGESCFARTNFIKNVGAKGIRLNKIFIKRLSRLKIEEAKNISLVRIFQFLNFKILVIKKAILKVAQRVGDPRSFDHYIWKL